MQSIKIDDVNLYFLILKKQVPPIIEFKKTGYKTVCIV